MAGCRLICGLDEAGRGPLAGPVVAAAVVLPEMLDLIGLDDSKRLSGPQRVRLLSRIEETAVALGIGRADAREIEQLNIRVASLTAMERAVANLGCVPDAFLVDGRDKPPRLSGCVRALIRGDAKSASVAAASIVAKVARDRIMDQLSQLYPGYGWEHNKGYPTKEHRLALLDKGPTLEHRRTYAPVRHAIACRQADQLEEQDRLSG
jgi:ribonuclease HII